MSTKVSIDGLADAILKEMEKMKEVSADVIQSAVTTTSKEALQELRSANPAGSGKYGSWSAYNKGWGITQTKTDNRLHKKATIHNKTHYRLTHLLENGHAKQNGGRTKAFPHIQPVAEQVEAKLEKNIRNGLEKNL